MRRQLRRSSARSPANSSGVMAFGGRVGFGDGRLVNSYAAELARLSVWIGEIQRRVTRS